jgi:DNA-binding MarR family transcriptional regulator
VQTATVVARTPAIGYTRGVGANQTRADRRDASDRAFATIGDRFIVATQMLRRSHRRVGIQRDLYWVGDRELTPVQVDALEVLCRRPMWRMREIADELGVDRSTATRSVAPLVDLGLATRRTDDGDRRNVLLATTEVGRATAARIADARREMMRSVLSRMTPERRVLLTELMEEYVAALDSSNELPDARS